MAVDRKPLAETALAAFAGLLDTHLRQGTRPHSKALEPWTNVAFAKLMPARADDQAGAAPTTIANWRKGRVLPNEIETILRALFGPRLADGGVERAELRAAYEGARSARATPSAAAANSTVNRSASATGSDVPPERAIDWPRDQPAPILMLAALELHTPVATNDGRHRLPGRLDLGERKDETPDQPIMIALTEAFLAVEAVGALTLDGSVVGLRDPHEHLAPEAGAVRIVGPLNARGHLMGDVLDGHHLAVLAPTSSVGKGVVTVTVSVPSSGWRVLPLRRNGEPGRVEVDSVAKQRVLATLLVDGAKRDAPGRTIVQQLSLRRKPKP